MKRVISLLLFATLFLSNIALADFKTESDMFKEYLISFHDKMVDYQREVVSVPRPSLYTDERADLYLLNDISRAYLNYSLFLIDEIEWLKLNSENSSVREYINGRMSKFNREGEYYVEYLKLRIKYAKNPEMIIHLKYLKKDISEFHSKIKEFGDDLYVMSNEEKKEHEEWLKKMTEELLDLIDIPYSQNESAEKSSEQVK